LSFQIPSPTKDLAEAKNLCGLLLYSQGKKRSKKKTKLLGLPLLIKGHSHLVMRLSLEQHLPSMHKALGLIPNTGKNILVRAETMSLPGYAGLSLNPLSNRDLSMGGKGECYKEHY
jgi:hypothetical protein